MMRESGRGPLIEVASGKDIRFVSFASLVSSKEGSSTNLNLPNLFVLPVGLLRRLMEIMFEYRLSLTN